MPGMALHLANYSAFGDLMGRGAGMRYGRHSFATGHRRKGSPALRVSATPKQRIKKSDLDEMELQLVLTKQKMVTAAEEQRYQDAAKYRDRMEVLILEQRCMDIQHKEGLRASICHRLGQLITHKNYKYRGVIFGVHHYPQVSESWLQTMRVDQLANGRHQPFYQILVDERDRQGGLITYVAQENIAAYEGEVDGMHTILNNEVGKFFTGFNEEERKYELSPEAILRYPDSLEAQEALKGLDDA